MAEINYIEQAKGFAEAQDVRGEDYKNNLGQLMNHAFRISQQYNITIEEALDNLVHAVRVLANTDFIPTAEFINDMDEAQTNYEYLSNL